MNCAYNPQPIRGLIRQTLVSLGASDDAQEQESLLIHSGAYCGHRIDKDGMRAVWFIEEDQIKFYGRDGSMLRAMIPSDVLSKKAA